MRRFSKQGLVVAAALAIAAIVIAIVALSGGGSKSTPSTTSSTSSPAKTHTSTSQTQTQPATARRSGVLFGISDNKPATFSDPLFRELGVKRARLNTPWNSIETEPARLDAWLQAARSHGIEPLVAFERARGDTCPAQPCSLPSVDDYTRAATAFHAKYPWVQLVQPWNEANSGTQPTADHPERAAAYYLALKRVCATCTIPAADVLDGSNLVSWLTGFKRALHGPRPRLWGLHNYSDTNRFRTTGTRHVLSLVPGTIWITESGGIVSFTTANGKVAFPYDEQRAARATRFLFALTHLSHRIARVYIYQWKIDFPGNRFDAGLVGQDGKPRPAFHVVLQHRSLFR